MFKDNFTKLCNKRNEAPSNVCKKIGLTASAYSYWTDESVPHKRTLLKIADYFNVTVDDLLKDEKDPVQQNGVNDFILTEREKELLIAYRAHPDMHPVIEKLLDMDPPEGMVRIFAAAKSEGNTVPAGYTYMTKERWERLKNAPETDEDLMSERPSNKK